MTIEEIIISYLVRADIPGIGGRVYAERPGDTGEPYVLVSRAAGSERDHIRDYLVYTDLYVKRDEESGMVKSYAMHLHEAVVEAMKAMPDMTPVFGCHKNTDYEATRPDSKDYRYQALWVITM